MNQTYDEVRVCAIRRRGSGLLLLLLPPLQEEEEDEEEERVCAVRLRESAYRPTLLDFTSSICKVSRQIALFTAQEAARRS